MADTPDDDVRPVARQVRQRLDGLKRAGVSRVPKSAPRRRKAEAAAEEAAPPSAVAQVEAPAATEPVATPPAPPVAPAPAPARRGLFDAAEAPVAAGPALSLEQRVAELNVIAEQVRGCPRCAQLVATRTIPVPGEGNPQARLMFLGEAPGADEDRSGRPFVGRAGQLLNDMITKGMGLRREDVFITNTIKCRPPGNRVPLPDEQANCREYLDRQLDVIRPEFLCLLGKTAALAMLGVEPTTTMAKLRGRWFDYKGIRTLVTFHPAYLLRNPAGKKDTWQDLQMLMAAMGIEPPKRGV